MLKYSNSTKFSNLLNFESIVTVMKLVFSTTSRDSDKSVRMKLMCPFCDKIQMIQKLASAKKSYKATVNLKVVKQWNKGSQFDQRCDCDYLWSHISLNEANKKKLPCYVSHSSPFEPLESRVALFANPHLRQEAPRDSSGPKSCAYERQWVSRSFSSATFWKLYENDK